MIPVARGLLLFPLSSQIDSGGMNYAIIRSLEWAPALDKIEEELCCVYPSRNTTDTEDHSTDVWKSPITGQG